MIRSDYIMRQIEQFVQAIAELLFREKNNQEFRVELDKIGKSYLGIDLEMMESMSFNQLKSVFQIDINQYHMKCYMAAEVFLRKLEREILESNLSKTVLENYLKTFELYFEAIQDNKYFQNSNVYKNMEKVNQIISKYDIDPEIKFKILRFYEVSGNYAEAENILFDLIDDKYDSIQEEGIKFYKRLLDLSDSKLVSGSLPREEVLEGLAGLKS